MTSPADLGITVPRVKNKADVSNAWERWRDFCAITLPSRGGQLTNLSYTVSQKRGY